MRHILSFILIIFLLLITILLSSSYKLDATKIDNSSVILVGQSIIHASPQDHLNNNSGYNYYKANILNYNMTNNGSRTAALIGKTEVNSLPNPGIVSPESQSHMIPFHPKNQSNYSADKTRAALGLNKS